MRFFRYIWSWFLNCFFLSLSKSSMSPNNVVINNLSATKTWWPSVTETIDVTIDDCLMWLIIPRNLLNDDNWTLLSVLRQDCPSKIRSFLKVWLKIYDSHFDFDYLEFFHLNLVDYDLIHYNQNEYFSVLNQNKNIGNQIRNDWTSFDHVFQNEMSDESFDLSRHLNRA